MGPQAGLSVRTLVMSKWPRANIVQALQPSQPRNGVSPSLWACLPKHFLLPDDFQIRTFITLSFLNIIQCMWKMAEWWHRCRMLLSEEMGRRGKTESWNCLQWSCGGLLQYGQHYETLRDGAQMRSLVYSQPTLTAYRLKYFEFSTLRSWISYFNHCEDQIPNKEQLEGGMDSLLWLTVQRDTARHGGSPGSWSHCVSSQEAESRQEVRLD